MYFFGAFRNISLQLFCEPSQGGGKFPDTPDFSGDICRVKYFSGYPFCGVFLLGSKGSGGSNCDCPVCFRNRNRDILLFWISYAAGEKMPHVLGGRYFKRNIQPFLPHLPAAVCDEFRHPYGTGACEQFWDGDYGGLCSSGENRYLCLHAGTGFWQCIFYLCGAKLRCRKKRADSGRDEAGSGFCLCVLRHD